ncbi:MAG: hypothetical protein ACYC1Q_02720 [Bacteroidia bacterium]
MNNLVRQLLSSASYRFERVTEDAPPEFANFSAGQDGRTALQLVNHMVNVLDEADAILTERDRVSWQSHSWEVGKQQFRFVMQRLIDFMHGNVVDEELLEILIHGPVSDLFGHIGQLTLMRRLSGKPINKVNYIKASVSLRQNGQVGAVRTSG